MNKPTLVFLTLIILIQLVFAQSSNIFIPNDIKFLYENGTRSMDGSPGPKYWQNRVDYKMQAELRPDTGLLTGNGIIKFFNNSPEKLDRLVFRLYPNIFKKGAVRDFLLAPSDINDGVNIKKLFVGDEEINAKPFQGMVRYTSTNMIIYLENEIEPESVTEIKVEWEFTLSRISNVRMGRYTDDDIFVAYWFPQIAVYDDITGWDMIEYTGSTEFYNEFGNFDVEITLPGDYLVWATGILNNSDEVLQPNIIEKLNSALNSDKTIHVVTSDDYKSNSVTVKNKFNTWKFRAENVSDFSFAVSKDYLWDAVGANVDKNNKHRITAHAVYPEDSDNFDLVAEYSKQSIEYLSLNSPGIPFPYPQMTIFCNQRSGGGMETPMMANNGDPADSIGTFTLTFHEIAHTYFPFYVGTNERKYSWMDEGWARFFPAEPSEKMVNDTYYFTRVLTQGLTIFGNETDIPIMTTSYLVRGSATTAIWYSKPFFAYKMLQNLLGDNLFKTALQEYINRWNGKHPIPYDFFFTFNNAADQNLSWFWNEWFFSKGFVDLGITNVSQYRNKIIIEVSKIGELSAPVNLQIDLDDGSFINVEKNISIWKNGKSSVKIEVECSKTFKYVNLINSKNSDINPENDYFAIGIM